MNLKTLEMLLKGLATYIPGYQRLLSRVKDPCPGGTITAAYCYSVWLRHLILAQAHGLPTDPGVVAEIGPGNSLGVGLCALLTGATAYWAFDVVRFSDTATNLRLLPEIAELLQKRARIPEDPEYKPRLASHDFPGHILTEVRLARSLDPDRVDRIKNCLLQVNHPCHHVTIGYVAPWDDPSIIRDNSVDLIMSQAVLEHVDDLEATYRALYRWLKPGGFMSHQIDYRCHGLAREWNGHWTYPEAWWRLLCGRRPFVINRHPHSAHLAMMRRCGFHIAGELTVRETSGIPRERLAPKFQGLPDDDLTTAGALVQALKPLL